MDKYVKILGGSEDDEEGNTVQQDRQDNIAS